jgi:TubC N-terminal docking domain
MTPLATLLADCEASIPFTSSVHLLPMTPLAELLADCEALGIRLSVAGDGGLTIDAPQDALTPALTRRLKTHKADLLVSLDREMTDNRPAIFDPTHPLATFDWDTSHGYCPGRPIIRNGMHHKREACTSNRSWRHVWGGRYCSDCWPPTDPLGVIADDISG